MTNFEYYKDEIEALGYNFAFVDGEVIKCQSRCLKCEFGRHGYCPPNVIKWLYEEHKEQPKLTKEEHNFLQFLKSNTFIARDANGFLVLYEYLPTKNNLYAIWDGVEEQVRIKSNHFGFIKWEDEEPWKVENLLKLEVME